MRFRSFSSVLDECLAAMRNGESAQACLERYPRHAERLRPLLTLATRVGQTPPAQPRPWSQETAWNVVRQRAALLREGRRPARVATTITHAGWLRPVAVALVLVFAVLGGGGATALAAQGALPDSPLYRVKLTTEDARVFFTFDDSSKADVLLDQSDTRIEEITEMVEQGKPIPGNVLSALRDRNERAGNILQDKPDETQLRARVLAQAEQQEKLLIDLWPQVDDSARDEYTQVVAGIHNTRLQGVANVLAIQPEELSGGVLSISGLAEQASNGMWKVGGLDVRIDERTIGHADLQPGSTARLVVARSSNGRLHGLSLTSVQTDVPPAPGTVSGIVEAITDNGIQIAGQLIQFDPETLRKLDLRVGREVAVELDTTTTGAVARSISPVSTGADGAPTLTFEGTLEGDVASLIQLTAAGRVFKVSPTTNFTGNIASGARVQVDAVSDGDNLLAQRVTVLTSDAAPSAVFITGTYQGNDRDGSWEIGGLIVVPAESAQDPAVGSVLAIEATRQGSDIVASGQPIVLQAPDQTGLVRFSDTITSVNGSLWTLQGITVRVPSTTRTSGWRTQVGVRVLGWGQQGRDGTLQTVYVRVLDSRPVVTTPTPAPEPAQ